MAIIFCRHGQTKFNLEDRFQGVSDSELTDLGISTAKKLNDFLISNFEIKKFFISPLPRVRQTYSYASKSIDAEMQIVPELREVCYGEWETKVRSELPEDLLALRKKGRFTFVHPGSYQYISGESYKDVYERLTPFFEMLKKSKEDICVIAHNGVLIAAEKFFENLSDDIADEVRESNDEVIIIRKDDGRFSVEKVII